MAGYAVMRADETVLELKEVARLIAETTGRAALDAIQFLHHGRGLLADHLTLAEAQQIGAGLRAAGLPTVVLPDSALLPISRPRRISKARLSAAGLDLEDPFQRRWRESWAGVVLVAATTVQTLEGPREAGVVKRALALVPHEQPVFRLAEPVEGPVELRQLLDLVCGRRNPRHYRLEAGLFNYRYLAAEGRLSLRRDENYLRLLEDVLRWATTAWVTPGTRSLRDGVIATAALVADERLVDAEIRWRRQRLALLGRPA